MLKVFTSNNNPGGPVEVAARIVDPRISVTIKACWNQYENPFELSAAEAREIAAMLVAVAAECDLKNQFERESR